MLQLSDHVTTVHPLLSHRLSLSFLTVFWISAHRRFVESPFRRGGIHSSVGLWLVEPHWVPKSKDVIHKQRRSREDLLATHSHMHLISFFLSLFTHGNAFRRWGKMSRGASKAPRWLYTAKSNKNRRKCRFEGSQRGRQISALLQSCCFQYSV